MTDQMWTRRLLVGRAAGLLAMGGLPAAACGVGTPRDEVGAQSGSRSAKLGWMAVGSQSRLDLHQKQIARFRELTGHDVELVHVTTNYQEKLTADLAAGTAGDIFRLESREVAGMVSRNQLEPIDSYLRRDRVDLADFYDKGIGMYQWQNKQYGLPWLAFRVLFYNMDLLQQRGGTLPPQDWKDKRWNWEAFRTSLRRFVTPGAPAQPGDTWAFHSPLNFLDAWVWVLSNGGDIFSADERTFTLDQPQALEGLQFYADLMSRDHAHPVPSVAAREPHQAAFLAGRVAFYYGAVATAGRLKDVSFRSGAAPVPWGKVSTNTTGGGHSWPMNAASKEKEAAWELQKFLGSKENDLLQVESGEAPPYRKSTATLPQWKNRTPPENPETLADSGTYLRPQPKVPTWGQIESTLNRELAPVWEGQRSPGEAVQAIKPQIEQLLQEGWRNVQP
jgi:multiple sugar transport system substrate-binding protein